LETTHLAGRRTDVGYEITKEDVRAGGLEDHGGALAEKLEAVSRLGVNLEFVIGRRAADKPGMHRAGRPVGSAVRAQRAGKGRRRYGLYW